MNYTSILDTHVTKVLMFIIMILNTLITNILEYNLSNYVRII